MKNSAAHASYDHQVIRMEQEAAPRAVMAKSCQSGSVRRADFSAQRA